MSSLREFAFSFDFHSHCEKLIFRVYKRPGSQEEIAEISGVLGKKQAYQYYGSHEPTTDPRIIERYIRENYRKETSFFRERKRIRWKLYKCRHLSSKSAKEIFIGFAGLILRPGTTLLEPYICLRPDLQNQGYGERVFACVVVKLLSNKKLFFENFSGIFVEIDPNNCRGLALKSKLLGNAATEKRNNEREDGLWRVSRTCDDGSLIEVKRRFFLCEAQNAAEIVFQNGGSQRVNTKDLELLLKRMDCVQEAIKCVSKSDAKHPIMKLIHVYSKDFARFISELKFCNVECSGAVTKVVNTFGLTVPQEVPDESRVNFHSFYIFFLSKADELLHPETIQLVDCKPFSSKLIAFTNVTSSKRSFQIRILGDEDEVNEKCYIGYLIHLKSSIFEVASEDSDWPSDHIVGMWTTDLLQYFPKKRRGKRQKLEFAPQVYFKKRTWSVLGLYDACAWESL